jgi:hypothetical protein
MKINSRTTSLVVAMGGLLCSGAALAQSTWTWDGSACNAPSCTAASGVTATVSGYGAETSSSAFVLGSVRDNDPYGLGITSKDASGSNENTNTPNHSIDNFRGSTSTSTTNSTTGGAAYAEALAVNFSQAVSLTQVAVDWTSTDSDAMIFRWDGAANPGALSSYTANQLPTVLGGSGSGTASGWTLVSSGQFAANGNQLSFANSLYSSYWLVSTALGQASGSTNNDGFKLQTFTGNTCAYAVVGGECKPPSGGGGSVPEPGTLALAAVAFLGLSVNRRRGAVARR